MPVEFKHRNRPADASELKLLRGAMGCPVPRALKAFLLTQDGGEPMPNAFQVGSDDGDCVQVFYGCAEIVDAHRRYSDRLPHGLWPVADTDCGNLVLVRDRDGAVLFWDHEVEEATVLANDMAAFLSLLGPPPEVTLKPGQVKRVWVSPEFLAKYGKKT